MCYVAIMSISSCCRRTSSVSPKSPTSPLVVSSSKMDSTSQEGRRGKFAKSHNAPTICIDSPDDVTAQIVDACSDQ